MEKSKISILKNGPAIVHGGCSITNSDGSKTDNDNDIYLCRCGHSKNKPFCDGAHKESGFTG